MLPALSPLLQLLVLVWAFALGCVVGSFLNVVIWRLPRGLTIGRPARSVCPNCKRVIRWYDNIPLLSFALLRRRCRDCGAPIAWRYPLVEGLTGLVFALLVYRQGMQVGTGPGQLVIMALVASLLIAGSVIDAEWFIIPDEITLFGLLSGLAASVALPGLHVGAASYQTFQSLTGLRHLDGLIASLIGAVGGGLLVILVAEFGRLVFRREAMGFGDVKVMAMLGAFFGWKVAMVTFFLSPFVGLAYGIPLLVIWDEHVMPYIPFMGIAALLAMVFRSSLCAYLEPLEYLVRQVVF
ncbi:MAG: prepilin peptidase [Planctomycetes bacterium]|nr:prepilin peptidase [Planctomycetota bacterium]